MQPKPLRSLAVFVVLTMLISSTALADTYDNDTNDDGKVDRVHIKTDSNAIWNEGSSYGYRVVGLTVASIDPHWNGSSSGIDSIRILPDRASAFSAMKAQNYPDLDKFSWNPVWPYQLFSSFFLLDNDTSANIYQVTPTNSGSTNLTWAKALIQIIGINSGIPIVNKLATYMFNNFISSAASSGIGSINGGYNNYAFNNSKFLTYDDWMNSPNLSLSPSVSAKDAHLEQYSGVGLAHEYQYNDAMWSHGSWHPVQAAAQVTYCYTGLTTYCWTTNAVYKGYSAQGF